MSGGVRRVVTGLDDQGRSAVLFDDRLSARGGRLLWHSETLPADNAGDADEGERGWSLDLLRSPGSSFVITELTREDTAAGPFMHATDTLDYAVVIQGSVRLHLETGHVDLAKGDCFVGRGNVHGWEALSDEPVIFASVLVPAHPVGAGATI